MPRRASFAEVSRSVTKKTGVKPELRKRATVNQIGKSRKKDSVVFENTQGQITQPIHEDIEQNETKVDEPKNETEENKAEVGKEPETGKGTKVIKNEEKKREDNSVTMILEDEKEQGEEDDEEDDDKGDKQALENEASQKSSRVKKLSKRQLRLQQEKMEEEQEREERRKRREKRKKKKEIQAQQAAEGASQGFDETAFRDSIYTLVKSALDLVMQQGDINITVDNLTPLMKGFELNTVDEDVKEMIMESLLNSYGLMDPGSIDRLVMKKQMEFNLQELEDCVDTAFAIIDQDQDGIITHRDVYRLMIRLGEVLWDDQVTTILQAADVDGDGKISKKDLFFFLLGREKTVKLEDQILNKLAVTNKAEGNQEFVPEDLNSTDTAQNPTTADNDVPELSSANGNGAEDTGNNTPNSSGAEDTGNKIPNGNGAENTGKKTPSSGAVSPLKAAPPPEDDQAAERRRKMFTGYTHEVISANTLASNGPTSVDKKPENVHNNLSLSIDIPVADVDNETDKKPDTEDGCTAKVDELNDSLCTLVTQVSPENSYSYVECTQVPCISTNTADWSDSGHVAYDVMSDQREEGSETECSYGALTLDDGISFLPAPEFERAASPWSPRSGLCSSTFSSHLGSYDAMKLEAEPEPLMQAVVSTQRQDALIAFNHNFQRLVSSQPANDVKGSSERVFDHDDLLPETSQQTMIMKEIEEQVLQSKETIQAERMFSSRLHIQDKLRKADRTTQYLGDGCESVVESIIQPVYVPPCARDTSSCLQLSLQIPRGRHMEELEDPSGSAERDKLSVRDVHCCHGDVLNVEECNSADILSKGYVSLNSPPSMSTVTFKLPINDVNDETSSFSDDVFPKQPFPSVSRQAVILPTLAYSSPETQDDERHSQESGTGLKIDVRKEGSDDDQEPAVNEEQREGAVDNAADHSSPHSSRDGERKMTMRRRSTRALRRSMTCHLITVKDLSDSFSPVRKDSPMRGSPSPARNGFSPSRREPSFKRREVNTVRVRNSSLGRNEPNRRESNTVRVRDLSTGRSEQKISMMETPDTRQDSSILSKSPSTISRQSFAPRRSSSLNRTYSPARRGESARFYSPTGRKLDSYRSYGFESSRAGQDSFRIDHDSCTVQRAGHVARCHSARTVRDFRNRPRKGWTSYCSLQRESHRDSFLGTDEATTPRFGGQNGLWTRDDVDSYQPNKETGRFYGPNFELIMSQKGEPKEFLQESLLRDAMTRAGGQHLTFQEDSWRSEEDGSPEHRQNRKSVISKQLERVKQMEVVIRQRRDNMATADWGDGQSDQHVSCMRRCATTGSLRSMEKADSLPTHNVTYSQTSAGSQDGRGRAHRARPRPKSCAGTRRPMATSNSSFITVNTMPTPSTSPTRPQEQQQRADSPTMHVLDLSSLLSTVNGPEAPPQEETKSAEKVHKPRFKPLARMLVAYERARRRQAAAVDGTSNMAATSISRQLQQGIPYRPSTPPQVSANGCREVAATPRRKAHHHNHNRQQEDQTSTDSFSRRTASLSPSSLSRHQHQHHHHYHQQTRSFLLSSQSDQNLQTRHSPLTGEGFSDVEPDNCRGVSDDIPLKHQRCNNSKPSVTFEFPEQAVCVLERVPITLPSEDN